MADKAVDSSEEEEPTISEDVVVTKYKMAGDMANRKFLRISEVGHCGLKKIAPLHDIIMY